MNSTSRWIQPVLLLFVLIVGLLDSTLKTVSAQPSEDRLLPYGVAGMASGGGQMLYRTLVNPHPGAGADYSRSIAMADVNLALAQYGLSCIGPP
jgi:hypothetical protein